MSSILKALKKLDDDKAARHPDELKIDAEILRVDDSPRLSSAGLLAVALLLLAGGSGATYMYMKRDRAPEQVSTLKSAEPSRPPQLPVTLPKDIKTEQLPAAIVIVPAQQQKSSKVEAPKQQKKAAPVVTAPAVTPNSKQANRTVVAKDTKSPPKINTATNPSPQSPPQASVKTVPALRVNGIAFQDGNAADSVAIINGVPVSSGASIEGVKIDEIHKNRVKFSYNGEKFEIPLGQSNR
jgi:hypothetical protein